MAVKPVAGLALRFFYGEVQNFHLRPIKKMIFQFDPFHANANSLRDFLFHLSSRRIRRTSDSCIIKTEVVCDRSEPIINLDLHNGMNVLFKCGNLTPIEIAREFNSIITKYDIEEEKPILNIKGVLKDSLKKKKK